MRIQYAIAAVAAVILGVSAQAANAGGIPPIPYTNIGTQNPVTYSFTATGGDIDAYFYGSDAAYNETVGVVGGTGGVPNHGPSFGQEFTLATNVQAGTAITLSNAVADINTTWYSNPALNVDGVNHLYATAFAASGGIPSGVYAAFEDLYGGGDLDYNDVQVVITGVSVSPVPLPGALTLFGAGLVGLGAYGWRKGRGSKAA
jgi:hypothetical protein